MKNETPKKIDITIPELSENEIRSIVRVGDDYILTDNKTVESIWDTDKYIEKAQYDAEKIKHIYSSVLDNESTTSVTTMDELTSLAQNTQNSDSKINKINGIVKYYINKEDLIGRVVETIENNINTNYTINYPYKPKKAKEKKIIEELKILIDKFNKQINIPNLIAENARNTYTEGNNIYYLMGNKDIGYSVVNYPLDMINITSMKIDDDNIIAFKVSELANRINKTKSTFKNLKSNKLIDIEDIISNEIKRDYPEEVYDAYTSKDRIALLNPQKVGLTRINQLKGLYGLTPIFKSLVPQLLLETIDKSDQKVLIQKTKKIYFQSTRKEILEDPKIIEKTGYAQASLLKAMGNETIVYSAMPFVEDLKLIEPKIDLTDSNVKSNYKLRILEALGISFISSESSTSITTTKINYNELLKVINRITKQLESTINKYYQFITVENGFPIEVSPTIKIEDTQLLDLESRMKLIETLYSKVSLSYDTVLKLLGYDYETEKNKRIKENEEKVDEDVFYPHCTSFTISGKEGDAIKDNDKVNNTNSNGSKKSENIDKNESDKQRQESLK
ncbi:hypothetical protein [Clostridium sp. ZBS18]|uniref:hypothetical protein n=1 Tax=Clostridium sp. ZBS18 TaxID=2949967 RepID=UPI00207AD162|nr:hypothetical protein [Clostridium sp. ZBS18]